MKRYKFLGTLIPLLFAYSFLSCLNSPGEERAQEPNGKYIITPMCMGDVCLGSNVQELQINENLSFRKDEFQYSMSSYIDSVLFIEWIVEDEILCYSRVSFSDLSEEAGIRLVVTKSNKLELPNGVRVGMSFKELKQKIPEAEFSKVPHESLGRGQYRASVQLDDQKSSLVVIDYEEKEIENKLDTLVTSISLNLRRE